MGVKVILDDGTTVELPWEKCEYMMWFLEGALSNECCYQCRFASTKRGSDITLGDFWGIEAIHPELGEKETDGVSLLLLNTNKGYIVGERLSQMPQVCWEEHPLEVAVRVNHQLTKPALRHPWRGVFYKYLRKKDFVSALNLVIYGNIWTRAKRKVKRLLLGNKM